MLMIPHLKPNRRHMLFADGQQLKLSLCRVAVQDAMIRGLTEYLETPLKAVLDFCDSIDALAKRRSVLLLDYDHHKRKHEAIAVSTVFCLGRFVDITMSV